jgi:hypothetical protein
MRQILFFAVRQDLLRVLEMVEGGGPLKYIRTGQFPKGNYESYGRGADIPNLGDATSDSAINCQAFLVCGRETPIRPRPLGTIEPAARFSIDQLLNPDTVTFTPGGMRREDVLLHGRVATASDSMISQGLMKRFHSAIRRSFTRVKAFYVGPNALGLLRSGMRLTISVQSPREFDLAIDP